MSIKYLSYFVSLAAAISISACGGGGGGGDTASPINPTGTNTTTTTSTPTGSMPAVSGTATTTNPVTVTPSISKLAKYVGTWEFCENRKDGRGLDNGSILQQLAITAIASSENLNLVSRNDYFFVADCKGIASTKIEPTATLALAGLQTVSSAGERIDFQSLGGLVTVLGPDAGYTTGPALSGTTVLPNAINGDTYFNVRLPFTTISGKAIRIESTAKVILFTDGTKLQIGQLAPLDPEGYPILLPTESYTKRP
jgi:hypothetical protein